MGKQPRASRALPKWTGQIPDRIVVNPPAMTSKTVYSPENRAKISKGEGATKYAGRTHVKALKDVLGK